MSQAWLWGKIFRPKTTPMRHLLPEWSSLTRTLQRKSDLEATSFTTSESRDSILVTPKQTLGVPITQVLPASALLVHLTPDHTQQYQHPRPVTTSHRYRSQSRSPHTSTPATSTSYRWPAPVPRAIRTPSRYLNAITHEPMDLGYRWHPSHDVEHSRVHSQSPHTLFLPQYQYLVLRLAEPHTRYLVPTTHLIEHPPRYLMASSQSQASLLVTDWGWSAFCAW